MARNSLAGRKILVVEDEAAVAMLLEDMFEDLGCAVVGPTARIEDALAIIETTAIDAAVLDVNLNGTASYRIADALAERRLPFLFITGYGEAGLDADYRDHPVVQKPFTSEVLEHALRKLTGKLDPAPLPD